MFASVAGLDLGAALARRAMAHGDPTRAVPPPRLVAGLAWRAIAIAVGGHRDPRARSPRSTGCGRRPATGASGCARTSASRPRPRRWRRRAGLVVGLAVGPRPLLGTLAPLGLWLAVGAAGRLAVLQRAAGVLVQPDRRLLPRQPLRRRGHPGRGPVPGAARAGAGRGRGAGRGGGPARRADLPAPAARAPPGRPAARRRPVAVVAALAATGMHLEGGRLGYAVDAGDIDDALGGRIVTPHFVIHYAHRADIDDDIAADRRRPRVPLRPGRAHPRRRGPGQASTRTTSPTPTRRRAGWARATSRWPSRGGARSTSTTARSLTRSCATRSPTSSPASSAIRCSGSPPGASSACRSSSTPV